MAGRPGDPYPALLYHGDHHAKLRLLKGGLCPRQPSQHECERSGSPARMLEVSGPWALSIPDHPVRMRRPPRAYCPPQPLLSEHLGADGFVWRGHNVNSNEQMLAHETVVCAWPPHADFRARALILSRRTCGPAKPLPKRPPESILGFYTAGDLPLFSQVSSLSIIAWA
jgi:hypothetical protein